MGLEQGSPPLHYASRTANTGLITPHITLQRPSTRISSLHTGLANRIPRQYGPIISSTNGLNSAACSSETGSIIRYGHALGDGNGNCPIPNAGVSKSPASENSPPAAVLGIKQKRAVSFPVGKVDGNYSLKTSLLDKSIEELSTPVLAPESSAKQSVIDISTQGILDGGDTEQPTEDLSQQLSTSSRISGPAKSSPSISGCRNRLRSSQVMCSRTHALQVPTRIRERFINPRPDSANSHERLILNASPSTLNPLEKTLRRRTNRSDPFGPDIRVALRGPIERPPRQRQRAIRPSRTSDIQTTAATSDRILRRHQRSSTVSSLHMNGNGAWTSRYINAQQDHLDARASVPVYTSRFLDKAATESDTILHIKRLALACDIDLSSKILSAPSSMYEVPLAQHSTLFWPESIAPSTST